MKQLNSVTRMAQVLCAMALIMVSCGGRELSLSDYVEDIDAVFVRAIQRYEDLVSTPEGLVLIVGQGTHLGFDDQGRELSDFTTEQLHLALEQVADIQQEATAAAAAIDPPEQLAELHTLFFRNLPIGELAARAGSTDDWDELSSSSEMEAYRSALLADGEVCADFQAKLDATADRGAFVDAPWIPGQLKEIVDYGLGCDVLPANPSDVFRP